MTNELLTIRKALERAPQRCPRHGTDFAQSGFWFEEPRCESCRQPYRTSKALKALDRLTFVPAVTVRPRAVAG
ncbi:hypothetical protein ACIGG9_16145 [Pseudonocardia alni]|uniref:hypothetical protein n=1 Tax=Pseudonocardia alni TaxID=33907 RepID=UPI0033C52024